MTRCLIGRIAQAIAVLWAAYTLTFAILYLLPSDPLQLQLAAAGVQEDSLPPAQLAALKHKFGLDQSIAAQYVHHLVALLHGDLGSSLAQGVPVRQLIADRLGPTLQLSLGAAVLSLVAGTALAAVATFVRTPLLRTALSRVPALGASVPQFFIALFLIQLFSFTMGWFPATGNDGIASLVLPVVTISVLTSSVLAQVLLKSFEEVLAQPYVAAARARGLSRIQVHLRHVLRNAALPAVTILGVLVGLTVTSSIVVETVFTRQGLGQLAQQSVLAQDVPVVLGVVTVAATGFVTINLLVDLLYPLLDPRISHGRSARVQRPRTDAPALAS